MFSSSTVIIKGLGLVVSFHHFNCLCCMMVCGCKQDILYILVTLFSNRKQKIKKLKPFSSISNQMKHFVFFVGIQPSFSFSKQFVSYHLDLTNAPKISPTITSLFKRLGMILVMKINSINHKKLYQNVCQIDIEVLKKNPNIRKNISPPFKYLNFIFQIATNFRSNSSTCKYFRKTLL